MVSNKDILNTETAREVISEGGLIWSTPPGVDYDSAVVLPPIAKNLSLARDRVKHLLAQMSEVPEVECESARTCRDIEGSLRIFNTQLWLLHVRALAEIEAIRGHRPLTDRPLRTNPASARPRLVPISPESPAPGVADLGRIRSALAGSIGPADSLIAKLESVPIVDHPAADPVDDCLGIARLIRSAISYALRQSHRELTLIRKTG